MRHVLASCLSLLLAVSAAAAPDAAADPALARVRAAVVATVAELHLKDAGIAVERIAEAGAKTGVAAESGRALHDWVFQQVVLARLAFAPPDAVHDARVRYRLPFPVKIPRRCAQSFDGALPSGRIGNHVGDDRYAVDFELPIGTEIVAARAGEVALVVDGFGTGGFDHRFNGKGNEVLVLHPDGTFAEYLHLRSGIPVRRGQRVAMGETLGRSGDSGVASGPHLHFAVYHRGLTGQVSVPIRFGVGSPTGYVPKPGEYYGAPPRPNRSLRVAVDGHAVDPDRPVRIARDASAQLHVELVGPGGARDVTTSPHIEYATMLPQSMQVDGAGRVRAHPDTGWGDTSDPFGTIGIFYVDGSAEIGLSRVMFEIVAPDPSSPPR